MSDVLNRDVAYERTDVTGRLAAALLGGIAAALIACVVILMLAFPRALSDRIKQARQPPPPAPRLQLDPGADLAALRAREQARLEGYGWVDRAHGVVHVPIEEAMRRVTQQGIPGWPGASR